MGGSSTRDGDSPMDSGWLQAGQPPGGVFPISPRWGDAVGGGGSAGSDEHADDGLRVSDMFVRRYRRSELVGKWG
jgi:hypothetical protein